MFLDEPAQPFMRSVRTLVVAAEAVFLDFEQELLKQKSFEDMAFSTSGFNETGDFFYLSHADQKTTAREKLNEYFGLRENFDSFIAEIQLQMREVAPENRDVFFVWVKEQLLYFELQLRNISSR